MRTIKEGDRVTIFYTENMQWVAPSTAPYDTTMHIDAVVLYTPADVGDYWQFQAEENGVIFAQNPMCSCLDKIVLKS